MKPKKKTSDNLDKLMFSKRTSLKKTDKIYKEIIDSTSLHLSESVTKQEESSGFKVKDVHSLYAYNVTLFCDLESRWVGTKVVPYSTGIKLESILDHLTEKHPDLDHLLAQKNFFSISVPGSEMWKCRHLELFIPGTESQITCPDCGGLGRLSCSNCNGASKVMCNQCKGSKVIGTSPNQSICPKCEATGLAPCDSCKGKGHTPCFRCNQEGSLLNYDFFVVSNAGDLCLTNIFPPSSNGTVEQITHEKIFYLAKDKCSETKNLLQGRLTPFDGFDESGLSLPPVSYGKHEEFVAEGETIFVAEREVLSESDLLIDSKLFATPEEINTLKNVTLESVDYLKENIPIKDKQKFFRQFKVVMKRKPYFIVNSDSGKNYFVSLNPNQVITESSLSWDQMRKLFLKYLCVCGSIGLHRFYTKRYFLGSLHVISSIWILIFLLNSLKSAGAFFWFALLLGVKIFWLFKEKNLIDNCRMTDIDGNPLVKLDQEESNKKVEFETLPDMDLPSLSPDSFERISIT